MKTYMLHPATIYVTMRFLWTSNADHVLYACLFSDQFVVWSGRDDTAMAGDETLQDDDSEQQNTEEEEEEGVQPTAFSDYGAIIPMVQVAGTATRRAVEATWLTASNPKVILVWLHAFI